MRAEISELALISIFTFLFVDAPLAMKRFDEFTKLPYFNSVGKLSEPTVLSENANKKAKVSNSRKSAGYEKSNSGLNQINTTTSEDINLVKDEAVSFLMEIKKCLSISDYRSFLDRMIELRAAYQNKRSDLIPQVYLLFYIS